MVRQHNWGLRTWLIVAFWDREKNIHNTSACRQDEEELEECPKLQRAKALQVEMAQDHSPDILRAAACQQRIAQIVRMNKKVSNASSKQKGSRVSLSALIVSDMILLIFCMLYVGASAAPFGKLPGRRFPHSFPQGYGLPTLHKIQQHKFSVPYSCGGSYNSSALFLSSYSQSMNAPDLLYNGPGGSPPSCLTDLYFEASTAGDDMSVLSDLGVFPLTNVSAMHAFNVKWQTGFDNKFLTDVPVVVGHTYSALLSKSDIRALYAFTVVQLNHQTGALLLDYAVLMYEVANVVAESPGFSWDAPNTSP